MITFKFGGTHGGRSGVVLRSKSSQTTIDKLTELDLALTKPAKADETPASASLVPEKAVCFYPDGRKLERWSLLLSTLPLSLVLGLGYWLLFTDAPQWSADAMMLAGLIVFGLAGCLIEKRMLKAFACPRCQTAIEDWDTDEKHRVLIHCTRCGSNWDIEYQLRIGSCPPRKKRRHRSDFLAICSARGAH